MRTNLYDITLSGLRADSLLGFMAAMGVLRSVAAIYGRANVTLGWQAHGSSYRPMLRSPADSVEVLIEKMHPYLKSRHGHDSITFDQDLKVSLQRFNVISHATASRWLDEGDSWGAAMIAAFGCGAVGNDDGNIEDTSLRTMSGAGHQHFLGFMNTLAKETTALHLHETLIGPWQYADPSPTLRWDAEDDRRYALRWDEPSKDPVKTVRGANRLAIEALPFFPVVPTGYSRVATTGFKGRRSHDTFISWPIWSAFLNQDVVTSILAMPHLLVDGSPRENLKYMGILAVFRSQRITLGKYRNFTPASSL
jgi:hypothetical protein